MARFTLPKELFFGKDTIEELRNLTGYQRAMIVTGGSSMKNFGFLPKLEEILKNSKMTTQIFEGVEPDPSVETVMAGAQAMQDFQPDIIVALGGGSTIDAAKVMWVFYEHPELTFEDIKTLFSIPKLRKKAIFVAIPSTSGTSTEVTSFAVITDYQTKIKHPIASYEITPDIAILDSNLPFTMPPALTAHTGMDALTHAIEAYVSKGSSLFSDPLSLEAITLCFENLVASYNKDEESRGKMHIAQCMAGMALNNALLGITHSLAHNIGAQFHISHGCCNAVLLPYVIQYNAKDCLPRYAQIAARLRLPGNSEEQLVKALIEAVSDLNRKLDIAPALKDYNVTKQTFFENLDYMAGNAQLDPCTSCNPRPTTADDLKRILEYAYEGKNVNF
jgi:alcohol dehydrogenase class IV